jgi:hypothetical protein
MITKKSAYQHMAVKPKEKIEQTWKKMEKLEKIERNFKKKKKNLTAPLSGC